MKLRLEDKRKAIGLRLQGKSYREIMAVIPNLSKSTLSGWLKCVKLTSEQEKELRKHIRKITYNARVKAAWARKQKNKERVQKTIAQAKKEYFSLSKNPFFLIGLVLYWTEGSKKAGSFQFSNSDSFIVRAMMRWLTEICKIPREKIKFRVFIHKIYAQENCEEFWSKITGIPVNKFQKTIYKPTPHKLKKNPEYKGCVQIRVLNTEFLRRVIGWEEGLIKDFQLN